MTDGNNKPSRCVDVNPSKKLGVPKSPEDQAAVLDSKNPQPDPFDIFYNGM